MFLFGSKADIILFVFRTDQRLWKIEWDLSIKKLHSLVSSGRWDLRTEFNPFLFFFFLLLSIYWYQIFSLCYLIWSDMFYISNIQTNQTVLFKHSKQTNKHNRGSECHHEERTKSLFLLNSLTRVKRSVVLWWFYINTAYYTNRTYHKSWGQT